jgi:hypothetical protein
MTAAPSFRCAECTRLIGKTRGHILVGYPEQVSVDRLLCARCMVSTKRLHAKYFPDCPVGWHDLHDHGSCSVTRAGAASLLGVWP